MNNTAARKSALDRYFDALRNLPPSGGGGCHVALLGIANRGRVAGVNPEQVVHDLAEHAHGTRMVPNVEIEAAVNKAYASPSAHLLAATKPPAVDGAKLLKAIVERRATCDEAGLWEASSVRIDWPPERDSVEVLRRLYAPDERLFAGSRYDSGAAHVLPCSEWIARFERGCSIPEHIICNPLTGEPGQTKDGKPSYRADSCVARFKFAVVEFDAIPRQQQISFWAGAPLPVVALIDSGGKSVHGWIRIDASDANEWALRVESKLFSFLTAVGADGACKNEARLSRTPGHFRADKNRWQRLLYLNPVGGPLFA